MIGKFLATAMLGLGLLLATPAGADMTGTIVGNPLACFAQELDSGKVVLNRWIELNRKRDAGELTQDEQLEGFLLSQGTCGVLPEGLPVTVLLLDGGDYFVAAIPDPAAKFVLKSEGFQRDAE